MEKQVHLISLDGIPAYQVDCPCKSPRLVVLFTDVAVCECKRRYYVQDNELVCDTSDVASCRPLRHHITQMPGLSIPPGASAGFLTRLTDTIGISTRTRSHPIVIGISGYRGSGKDTAAKMITGRFPILSGMYRVSFADTLRDTVRALYGFTMRQMTDTVLKEQPDPFWGISPRDALRIVGTDCMRKGYRDDVWILCLQRRMQRIRATRPGVKGFVIPDVRFENELAMIQNMGGEAWVLYRPGCEYDGHVTESLPLEPARFKHVINNDGTRADLRYTIRTLYKRYGL